MNNLALWGVGEETLRVFVLYHEATDAFPASECALSLLCRGDSQTAAFLNLQPAFRLIALLIIHYKLHTRDAGVPRSVIVT